MRDSSISSASHQPRLPAAVCVRKAFLSLLRQRQRCSCCPWQRKYVRMCLKLQRVSDNYLLTTLESSVSGAPEVNRLSIRLTVIGSSTARSCQMCCKLPVSFLFFFFNCVIFFFSIPFSRSRRSVFWLGVTLQLSSRQQIKEISLYMIPRGSRLRVSRVSGSCANGVRLSCVVGQDFDLS